MTAETSSSVVLDAPPDIYLWMAAAEATEALDASIETIELRAREGDLESRVNDQGEIEVLVRLSSRVGRLIDSPLACSIQERRLPGGPTLLPLSGANHWNTRPAATPSRRSTRLAWSVAAAMVLVAGTAALFAASIAIGARDKSTDLSRRLEMVSLAVNDLSSQRDRLRGQLSDATSELTKVQGELAVDRNVEDTLFKAIQTAQSRKTGESKSPQFADIGH